MSHPWTIRRGRTKVIRKCKYCGEDFCARDLQAHGPICPKRPTLFRGFQKVKCRFCGEEMCSKAFQPHLRDYCPNAPKIQPAEYVCTACQEIKVKKDLYRSIPNNYTCKECIQKRSADRYAIPEMKERQRYRVAQTLYGIPPEDYKALEEAQGGKCAICGEVPSGKDSRTDGLAVDHDHGTGAIRGLLCHRCNHGIGSLRDREDLLLAAIDYLRRHRSRPVAAEAHA